ncbi:MAG: TetR/AcrR family transcriptional regulator [Candidatus Hydrogenedentota bacterium]|nr:MAG: TetR/AcrR family transcriptional regulator [Candidatus Hydrogenedentota bacterium]
MAKKKSEYVRKTILDAAVKVVAQKGYYNAKTAEIAKQAGVASGTIYNYFKGKDDILISVFNERLGDMVATLRGAMKRMEDVDSKISLIVTSVMQLFQTDRDLAEILVVELRQSAKFLKSTAMLKLLEFLELIEEVIIEGRSRGMYRKEVDPAMIAVLLVGCMEAVLSMWIISDLVPEFKKKYDYTPAEASEAVLDLWQFELRTEEERQTRMAARKR